MEAPLSAYNQALLTHYKHPLNKTGNQGQSFHGYAENSLCGDSVEVHFEVQDGCFHTLSFDARACMIVVATASMVTEWLEGKSVHAVNELEEGFRRLMDEADYESGESWGVLKEIHRFPTRRKCLELTVRAFQDGLREVDVL